MKKLKCIILEDEEVLLLQLAKNIGKIEFLELCATFQSPTQALSFLNTNPVDLIFLDLQMPNEEIDGLTFMGILDNNFHYILTTAHPNYALKSYEYNVIDYLHKPYSFERFLKATHKAQRQIKRNNQDFLGDYLYIRTSKILQKIKLTDIYWFESDRNLIRVFTENDEISFLMTMEDLMAQLPENQFLRIHRSFIVSIDKINLIHDDYVLISRDGTDKSIRIGNTYRAGLKAILEGRILRNLR